MCLTEIYGIRQLNFIGNFPVNEILPGYYFQLFPFSTERVVFDMNANSQTS